MFSTKLKTIACVVGGLMAVAGSANAELIKETGLSNGMASGGLILPVQSAAANYWSGLQVIQVNGVSMLAYCVDPYQWSPSSLVTYTQSNFNTFFGSRAASIKELYSDAYAATLPGNANGNLNAAAFQLALWELVADSSSINLSTGNVRTTTNTNASIKTAAQTLLNNVNGTMGSANYSFTLYTSSTNQDYLVATAVPVPEPETLSLLMAGLGLSGVFASRRRKQGA